MAKRKYTFRKRRDGKNLERVSISANDIFLKELKLLSSFYKEDKSSTISICIKEFLNHSEVQQDFKDYYNSIYKLTKDDNVYATSVYQVYNFEKDLITQLEPLLAVIDASGEKTISRSLFIRALISYFKKIKVDDQLAKVKRTIAKIRKSIPLEINHYGLTEDGLHVVFNLNKK
jgi:hypothetical protein